MASIKEIRTHIRSVEQTLKITNAMYLISSANLRKAKGFSQEELAAALSSFSVGDSVNVIIYRSGRQLTADIVLQEATQ